MNEKLLGGIFYMGVLKGERVEREVNDSTKRGGYREKCGEIIK